AFRQSCLQELRNASRANLFHAGPTKLEPADLARRAGAFARYSDPLRLLDAEFQLLGEVGAELRQAGHPNLAQLVVLRPQSGEPLLLLAVRYFFRRAVEEDQALFQGLAFTQMQHLQSTQEAAFGGLHAALAEQGARLERLLDSLQEVVSATHET